MKRRLLILLALVVVGVFLAQSVAYACTTIIVGKNRTADHSVLIAHNEDDGGIIVMHYNVYPSRPGGSYLLFGGGSVVEPSRTVSYMGPAVYDKAVIPGDFFGGVNAYQVAMYNNLTPGKLAASDVGVMWTEFNELASMQAKTAREAVQIMGRLTELYGLASDPGTAFGVADPKEGWWIEIGPGGQWVAQRVPDDGAQMIANCYRIGVIDFKDKHHKNFMWSSNVVSYAEAMGWYDPASGPFNFAQVYGTAASLAAASNTVRMDMVQRYLDALHKVKASDLMSILRSHYEGSEYDVSASQPTKFPHHSTVRTVCALRTQTSFVTQLRGWLPNPIGAVVWMSLRSPCSSVYVPWYGGINSFPEPYTVGSDTVKDESAWWAFDDLVQYVDTHYFDTIATVQSGFAPLEKRELAQQRTVDRIATILWCMNPKLARAYITCVSGNYGMQAYDRAQSLLAQINPPATP
jgi:dipeptidase